MGDPVYMRSAPPFPFGSIARAVPRGFILYTGVDPLNLGTHEGKGYLLKLAPFDSALTLDVPAPPWPFGCNARRSARYWTTQGKAATIYPAATGNAARSTLSTDTPASTWVPGKLSGVFNYEISLFSGADPLSGGSATIGVLTIQDPDGELDGLRTLGWDGTAVQLLRGDPEALFSTFSAVANLSTAGILYDLRRKEIRLRDLAWKLNQAELHGLRYAGTGSGEGDATLSGRIKPYCIGSVFNISPVQVDSTALIFQVSCSSVLAFDAVKDGGVAITFDADYATYDLLAAALIAGGKYATCLALGMFRLGSAPVYIITADVRGDNDTINGLKYPSKRAEVARRIATGGGNIRLNDPADLDSTAYTDLNDRQPATLGYYWSEAITKADALTEVMAGCLGWWTMRLDGRLAIGQLIDPATATAVFSLSYPTDANSGEVRIGEPAMTDFRPPRRATLMGYARNYTPMAVNQIAGAVSQVTSSILQAAGRYTTSADPWVAAAYPTAPVVSVLGGFASSADAQLEGNREQRILRVRRESFEIPAVLDPFGDVVARIITVENSNRLGMGAAKNLFCSGVAVNGNGQPILRLWG